ncbi:MAG: cytochrome c biogenesis protein CcsA, partial [Dehalococcoidia bacterium]|nr:cytochrome c biogenesis protein CcsA [Dehalococcoidia bacterium]
MIADLGFATLVLALVACAYSIIVYAVGIKNRSERALMSARNALYGVVILVSLASVALLWGLLARDFSMEYVASYSSRATSTLYTIAGFWAGNGGSLLFWALVLGICGLVLVLRHRKRNPDVIPYAAITILATEALFLVLMIFVQNPFKKLGFTAMDGQGLNPLLQNPGMLFHPPLLLAGYAAVTIPFALVVAALFTKDMNESWLGSMRKWTLICWLLLGVGNILGMQWAYVELGWGGYWAWDAVENAGFMPWLLLTALLHSLMIQRRRGSFKGWNMGLAGGSFFLAIFGTFLTRSNILSSVHTFGDSGMEPYFLFFMTLGAVLFIALMIYRGPYLLTKGPAETFLSRETGFALNNLALVAATLGVLLGTMSPFFSRIITGNTITVGPA